MQYGGMALCAECEVKVVDATRYYSVDVSLKSSEEALWSPAFVSILATIILSSQTGKKESEKDRANAVI